MDTEQEHKPTPTVDAWDIPTLFKRAYKRVTTRFGSIALTILLSTGFIILAYVAVAIVGGIVFGIFLTTKSPLVTGIIALIVGIPLFAGLIFVNAWVSLSMIMVLIGEKEKGAWDVFKEARLLVFGFFKYSLFYGLFMVGLLYLIPFTFMIVPLLWAFWGIFGAFVYIEQKKQGLDNLWTSYTMVNQKFWSILGRIVIIYILIIVLNGLISNLSSKASGLGILTFILFTLTGPFITSYIYEIYKNLEIPTEVKKPQVWIVLSMIGWVITVLVFISAGVLFPTILSSAVKNMKSKKQLKKNYVPVYQDQLDSQQDYTN